MNHFEKPNGKEAIANEIAVLRKLDHQNILKLYAVFETENSIYMVMDLLEGGHLRDRIRKIKQFTEQETANILMQLFSALQHMHQKKIMHRDIKPENLMYKDPQNTHIMLVDFGLASFWDLEKYLFPRCGTPGFVAPEIANNKSPDAHYTGICDVFSLGCVMHSLLLGKSLFRGQTHLEVLNANKECQINLNTEQYTNVSGLAMNFMQKCLEKNPEERITIDAALNHPFITMNMCSENIGSEASEFDQNKQLIKFQHGQLKNPFQEKLIALQTNVKINKIEECNEEDVHDETPKIVKNVGQAQLKEIQKVTLQNQQQQTQQIQQLQQLSPKGRQQFKMMEQSIVIPQLQNINSRVINNNNINEQGSKEDFDYSDASASINQEGIQQQIQQLAEMKQISMGFAPPQKLSTSPMIQLQKNLQKQSTQIQQQQMKSEDKKNNEQQVQQKLQQGQQQQQQQYVSEFKPPSKTLTSPQISLVHKFEPLQTLQKK